MSAAATGKIDVHAHYLPDFYATALREAGFTPGPEGLPAIPVRLFPFAEIHDLERFNIFFLRHGILRRICNSWQLRI